ncbi:MAG TPA: four-carbon acid sugar kinase family protein [Methylomirabilota bacterium]|nr:four-carbon acid sugar kinase family protein [Methylomirabilota bacterium]
MPSVVQAGIQADDLTGACDTGAPFAGRGLRTLVLFPEAAIPAAPPDVLVLDTESRELPAAEARGRARAAVARLAECAPAVLYKKVDSTLRGAVAAELAGALEGARRPCAILAPAFPAQRRTVVEGRLRIGGIDAADTAVARDPAFPATGADVLALLGETGPRPIGLIPLATVRRGPAALAARLAREPGRAGGALVCDAETDTDLAVLAGVTAHPPPLLAGSAGLAAALAARQPGGSRTSIRLRRPLLVVSGSAHPVTHAQLARLEARGARGTWLSGEGPLPVEDATFVAAGAQASADDPARRAATVAALVQTARDHVERITPATLLLTGGETAISVCRRLGARGIALAGQLEPGLALGTLLGGPFDGLTVITKAGGFGDPDTLRRVWEACA